MYYLIINIEKHRLGKKYKTYQVLLNNRKTQIIFWYLMKLIFLSQCMKDKKHVNIK